MAVFRCKMCGGSIEFEAGSTVGICDSCGTVQTLPKIDDDRRAAMYDRANHYRRNNEFDKASGIYEQILNEDPTDAEAYWSIVICRYGIEYVEDPESHKMIPTVNRAQFTSIYADEDYKAAIANADGYQKTVYEAEAKAIDKIQQGILAISAKEDPFDVFISFKETGSDGRRTRDAVLARELYGELIKEGFKVFFAPITLEDKLGEAYEPYIFAALNSAKVMVVLGTKPEYFNAVWVKNEWSRYLALIRQGTKKTLIPAYKDMDPYDLPEEFSNLLAQDMSKLGFMQDLIRGIKKYCSPEEAKQPARVSEPVSNSSAANIAPLLERAFMFLEDGEWSSASEYCERVLDQNPKCAEAYLGKLLAELRLRKKNSLAELPQPFDSNNNYIKAVRFGDESLQNELNGYIDHINERNENERLLAIYNKAKDEMFVAKTEEKYRAAASAFKSISEYKDADERARECLEKAEICRKNAIYAKAKDAMSAASTEDKFKAAAEIFRKIPGFKDADECAENCRSKAEISRKDAIYDSAKAEMTGESVSDYEAAIEAFKKIPGWKDSESQIIACRKKIEEIKAFAEATERRAEEERIANEKVAKKWNRIAVALSILAVAAVAAFFVVTKVVIPASNYSKAISLMESGEYESAIAAFTELGTFKDSQTKIEECRTAIKDIAYNEASALMESGEYESAIAAFTGLGTHRDSQTKITECETAIKDKSYNTAVSLMESGVYKSAIVAFEKLGTYKDSKDKVLECKYNAAVSLTKSGDYESAYAMFTGIRGYKDVDSLLQNDKNLVAIYKTEWLTIGNIVTFGSYEQDNNKSNGREDIEWIVLATEGDKSLIISKQALDCKPYNTEWTSITWETCSLRKWLNEDFFNSAFSAEEQAMIDTTKVKAEKNPEYSTDPGKDTEDKVFLLSINEANKYFSSDEARMCAPTAYAEARGAYTGKKASGEAACRWWLRSPGGLSNYAAYVINVGSGYCRGSYSRSGSGCVRPALWIQYDSSESPVLPDAPNEKEENRLDISPVKNTITNEYALEILGCYYENAQITEIEKGTQISFSIPVDELFFEDNCLASDIFSPVGNAIINLGKDGYINLWSFTIPLINEPTDVIEREAIICDICRKMGINDPVVENIDMFSFCNTDLEQGFAVSILPDSPSYVSISCIAPKFYMDAM